MWLAIHTQQQNSPHRLILLLQHDSVSEIGQRFKAGSANTIIFTSQHPLSPKNLRSSHNATGIILKTKHIPYSVQNPQKHHT